VTVKKGDFLEKIAKAHNTTVASIMKASKMSSTNLRVGQVLQVPVNEKSAASAPKSENDYYVVKEGDNPWLIASKNRIRLEDLLKLNGLDEAKARKLRPGDRLKIR
jgi:peptidoglycan DL-endopeptidase LytF